MGRWQEKRRVRAFLICSFRLAVGCLDPGYFELAPFRVQLRTLLRPAFRGPCRQPPPPFLISSSLRLPPPGQDADGQAAPANDCPRITLIRTLPDA